MDTNPNSDTHLKNRHELDNLSTEFGKLSLAGAQQSTNQFLGNTKTKSSDRIQFSTPHDFRLGSMPKPSITNNIENFEYINVHLYHLNRNIYKSSLKCRVNNSSKTVHESIMHLVAFQAFVIDHGKFLAGCKQWFAVVDYVFVAWKHVYNMPIVTGIMHERVRSDCFLVLLRLCLIALNKLKNKLSKENKEYCLKYLRSLCDSSHVEIVKKVQDMFFKYIYSTDFLE